MEGDATKYLEYALKQSKLKLKQDIKGAYQECNNTQISFRTIELEEDLSIDTNDIDRYVEAMRQEIEHINEPLQFNVSKNLNEIITMLKKRIKETNQYIVYKKADIQQTESEIKFFKKHITDAKAALLLYEEKGEQGPVDVTPQQIQMAKNKFQHLKTELHRLIEVLFGNNSDGVIDLLGALCIQKLSDNQYLEIEDRDLRVIETLKKNGIITTDPYDLTKIKLSF